MKNKFFAVVLFAVVATNGLFAQKQPPQNWQLLDPVIDNVYGMGVEEAYKLLKGKKSKTVIVAVIDCGVDIEHEDLKDVIWTNPGEIPDNGIDDDKNGYIDDIHGWSFLGGKTEDINYEALEMARMYRNMHKKFKNIDPSTLSGSEAKEYTLYKKIKTDFLIQEANDESQLQLIILLDNFIRKVKINNNGTFSKKALKGYKPKNKQEKKIKKFLKRSFSKKNGTENMEEELEEARPALENTVKMNSINVDSIRQLVVGDDPNDTTDRFYGCNRVEGPDALHGTHVAGIIAAKRDNNIGIDGVADNVLIMPVRAVPNGDERDKDVANAIRYAVDNGATVINMSFGKYYSPNKSMIDEAVKYAESKDVLLIHAAGNESKNSDTSLSFPQREMGAGPMIVKNWIQVGANSYKPGEKLIADFSNYGLKQVDFFAPGVSIYSTTPDKKYRSLDGTSMASPCVAGVAALVREYFPELKADEVRAILMKNVVHYDKPVKVPGDKKAEKKVEELCISGGFVNVKAAVLELLKEAK